MSRNTHIWLPDYLRGAWRRSRPAARARLRHVYFCVADHYEPLGQGGDADAARDIVAAWRHGYRAAAAGHCDSWGRPPQHTFFYPAEEYAPHVLDDLASLCRDDCGDVEVHLHHDDDTAERLADTLVGFKHALYDRHGLLRREAVTGEVVYAFVHGNWALDNSRPDGRWCGVDNELEVLVRTGCRLDMTMPSAPSPTQTRKINSIYFASGAPCARKSHDTGRDVAVGTWGGPDELLLIQGPLLLNWQRRKGGLVPRIENGEISADNPPTAARVQLWGDCGVTVRGADEHLFIKIHTHGAQAATMAALLGGGLQAMWRALEEQYRDRDGCTLHYLSAWEMYEKVRALAVRERAA